MKRFVPVAALVISLAQIPLSASAAQPLDTSQSARQQIQNIEYRLNQPGVPAAKAQTLQNQVITIEENLLTSDTPPIPVPVFASCEANSSVLTYLQTQIQNANLSSEDQYTVKRNIHDVGVTLKQLGC